MILRKILLFVSLFLVATACVEVYDVRYTLNANVITVDGTVTNQRGLAVNLRTSRSSGASYYSEPLRECTVEVLVGNGSVVLLKETSSGVYTAPENFEGQVGQTYKLRFKTPSGTTYESDEERLSEAPPIGKIYHKFNQNGILERTGNRVLASSLDVYIDFNDPANQKNHYLWRWVDFEDQRICATCEGGKLDVNTRECVAERNSKAIYDYLCETKCWEIYYSNEVNVFSDVYTNGRTVTGRLAAKVPYYYIGTGYPIEGALVEIQQYAITSSAYDYYKILSDQAQNTGNLTDTPPAAIIGNVHNVNDPTEKTAGYFGAAGVSKMRLFIDKRPYFSDAFKYLTLGRNPVREPDTPPMPPDYIFRPPFALCRASANRTPIQPAGWMP